MSRKLDIDTSLQEQGLVATMASVILWLRDQADEDGNIVILTPAADQLCLLAERIRPTPEEDDDAPAAD